MAGVYDGYEITKTLAVSKFILHLNSLDDIDIWSVWALAILPGQSTTNNH